MYVYHVEKLRCTSEGKVRCTSEGEVRCTSEWSSTIKVCCVMPCSDRARMQNMGLYEKEKLPC